jgi:hypothetical protein
MQPSRLIALFKTGAMSGVDNFTLCQTMIVKNGKWRRDATFEQMSILVRLCGSDSESGMVSQGRGTGNQRPREDGDLLELSDGQPVKGETIPVPLFFSHIMYC